MRRWAVFMLVAVVAGGAGYLAWINFKPAGLPPGFASSNGRLEAERVDVATRFAGRVDEILVKEGEAVAAGQVLARMDTAELEAQLREAEASVVESEQQLDQAIALLAQRGSERALAEQEYERARTLGEKGITPLEQVEQREAAKLTAEATVRSANAGVERAKAAVTASIARVERIKENLKDYVLTAPRDGRIEYRLAQPGEVLGAGGRILTLLDLTDVYMTVFLPTMDVGTLELGAEARIVPDAAPQYVVPATVTFIASDAQFTPKYVETQSEREKLVFRVKVSIPTPILERYAARVKAGVTGLAYVRIAPDAPWPDELAVNLPVFEGDV